MWHLLINGPGHSDTLRPLSEGTTSVGRAEDNDVVLNGEQVSRRHARLHLEAGALRVEDLGSRNGSRVNGQPLHGSRVLQPGDALSLGENTITVRRAATRPPGEAPQRVAAGAPGVRSVERSEADVRASVLLSRAAQPRELLRTLHGLEAARAPGAAAAPAGALETLALLYRSAEALATAPSLQAFLDVTVDRLLERTGATTAVVLLPREGGLLTPGLVRHRGAPLAQGEVPVSDAIVAAALRQGSALVVGAAQEDSRFSARTSVVRYAADRVVCIPLEAGGALGRGVLYVTAPGHALPEPLLDACAAVAHLLSAGLQRFGVREVGPDTPRLRQALERALAPGDVERRLAEVHARPGSPLGLEDRPVTLLWAELVDYGPLAAQLGPSRAGALLGEFRSLLSSCVFAHGGSLEGFLGDGARALFGAPYAHGDDAVRAVRAALALRRDWAEAMEAMPPGQRCFARVGVHAGRALAGLLGSGAQLTLTAAGEGVEVAGLLAAGAQAGQVLISGKTLAAVGVRFDVTPLGERLLRAPDLRSAVFEVLQEDVEVEVEPR